MIAVGHLWQFFFFFWREHSFKLIDPKAQHFFAYEIHLKINLQRYSGYILFKNLTSMAIITANKSTVRYMQMCAIFDSNHLTLKVFRVSS